MKKRLAMIVLLAVLAIGNQPVRPQPVATTCMGYAWSGCKDG